MIQNYITQQLSTSMTIKYYLKNTFYSVFFLKFSEFSKAFLFNANKTSSFFTCIGRLYFLQAVTWAITLAWVSLLTLIPFTLIMHCPGWRPAAAATVPLKQIRKWFKLDVSIKSKKVRMFAQFSLVLNEPATKLITVFLSHRWLGEAGNKVDAVWFNNADNMLEVLGKQCF